MSQELAVNVITALRIIPTVSFVHPGELKHTLACKYNHLLLKNTNYTFFPVGKEIVALGVPLDGSCPPGTFVTTDSGVFWRESIDSKQWIAFFTKEKATMNDVPSFVEDIYVVNPENFTATDDIGKLPEITAEDLGAVRSIASVASLSLTEAHEKESPKSMPTEEDLDMVQAITSVSAFAVSEACRKDKLKLMPTAEDLNQEPVKGASDVTEEYFERARPRNDEDPVEEIDHKHKRYDNQNKEPETESLLDERPIPVSVVKSAGHSLDNIFTGGLDTEQGIDLIVAECHRNAELRAYLKSRLLAILSVV